MRRMLKVIDGCVSFALSLVLLIAGMYAGYCLWDNHQIYSAAENVQAELLNLKPQISEETDEPTGPTFDELLAVNSDVCAWITLENTQIDYPVLQGETNLNYINTDVYGNFALAGSIFLDARSDRTFVEPYAVLYGHHMENSGMFGDLDLYKDKRFFAENRAGTLILPDRVCPLQVFACMLVSASEERVFNPALWADGVAGLLDYAQAEALCFDEQTALQLRARINAGESPQVLALTTCASEFTDARTIVLAAMSD